MVQSSCWFLTKGEKRRKRTVFALFIAMKKILEFLEKHATLLDSKDVAKLLGFTPAYVDRLAARGDIPAFHIGKLFRFDPDEIAAWIKKKHMPARLQRK